MVSTNSVYLEDLFQPAKYRNIVRKACDYLRRYDEDFNCIVFRGMSGALVGPHIAHNLNKYMVIARKRTDKSHSNLSLEGIRLRRQPIKYFIVDDFIYSGQTIRYIKKKMAEFAPTSEMVGIYLYLNDMVESETYNSLNLDETITNAVEDGE